MKEITTEEFDEMFDKGEDVTPYLDFESAARCNNGKARISITIPEWLMYRLDEEAYRRAISRSALINVVLVDWADSAKCPGQVESDPTVA
ncbi:type II toxin-antitoxin system BrnA family antitoxin [Paratractidigestivibacter sp.]|uniref:type II toxin-antitoxin system BrnA family antitoxin n=1 Tax=Paratractidigestivibacter sp. TaxID=2847316 RepID=UPI002AC9ECE3|nr:ribbon-helix-helix protein, CopG family [Paratractidigestivibacter sp.]